MNDTFTIRQVSRQDNKPLAAMIRAVFEEFKAVRAGTVYFDPTTDDLYALFTKPGSVCWVVEKDGEIIGSAGIFPTEGLPEKHCELVKFYIRSGFRNQGLGKILLQKCLDSAVSFGYEAVYLESLPEFSSAIHLYERNGFTPLKKAFGNSGHFGCTIWMVKDLVAIQA